MSELKLTIDGREVRARDGDTVFEAARSAAIRIPTLCAHEALEPYGACRLCIVEIEGIRGFPTSCTTPATEGMVVRTDTDAIMEERKEILKLLLSGHTSPCLVCSDREACEKYRPRPFKTGKATRCTFCSNRDACELRVLAEEYGISDLDIPIIYKNLEIERNDPFMDRDYNLCILCGRCVRICEKIHLTGTIAFVNRGKDARISTEFHRPHIETNCRFCGACVDICPTGAMSDRFAKWYGTADEKKESTCVLCPNGCSIRLQLKDGKAIGAEMIDFTRDARICALGRFALPQIMENPKRLISHQVRIPDGLIKATYQDAVSQAAEKLTGYSGDGFALIAHEAAPREEIYVLQKFTKEVMKSQNFAMAGIDNGRMVIRPAEVVDAIKKGEVKALYTTGHYLDSKTLERLETLIVSDMFPSETEKLADVVFAALGPTEIDGTFLNADGDIKTITAAAIPPEGIFADWKIVCDTAKKMGVDGFDFRSTGDIQKEMAEKGMDEEVPAAPESSPLDDVSVLPRFYRGHLLNDIVFSLDAFVPERSGKDQATTVDGERPFKILEKVEIVPNTHMVTVHAPVIAEKCEPGQFIIAMVNEKSERIPYTISDFDREKGSITMIILEVGRSSREMANMRSGDYLAHLAGPLGKPVEVKKYGTVVCAGGCFGIGAILPIARAMKGAGNKVICIEEASSHYLLHWQERLSENCHELIIVTKDGSSGMKGGIQDAISMLQKRGEKIDQAYVVGCTFMMMLACETAKTLGIPTQTAMNPIMLDGTGMCGACRVSMGKNTKFACVDGPFLDGLQIDWIELIQRQSAFRREEVEALPQETLPDHEHHCMGLNA